MAAVSSSESVEIKFRLPNGSDIAAQSFEPETKVIALKEAILSQFPADAETRPGSVNDIKLINAGKVLDNSKTVAESRVPIGEIPGGPITMHVVIRIPLPDASQGEKDSKTAKSGCSCSIL